jgi:hypothetical protein
VVRGPGIFLLFGLAGCDQLFQLQHIEPDAALMCPTDYVELAGQKTRYRYIPTPQPWQKANDDCNNDLDGKTHLVVFGDRDEILAVRTLVTDVMYYNVHVGYARNTAAAGGDPMVFYAVTGETLDYESPQWGLWNPAEPNNFGGIETIVFIEHDKTLMDGEPTRNQQYICECDGRPATKTEFTLF